VAAERDDGLHDRLRVRRRRGGCLPPANAPGGVTCQCDRFGRANLNPSTIFNANWLLSTSSGAFGIPQITNPGYLRLTDNTGNNSSAATVPGIFPAAGNWVSVEFQNYAYNGSGADGIAVTCPTTGRAHAGGIRRLPRYAQKTGINGFAEADRRRARRVRELPEPTEGRIGGRGPSRPIGVRGSDRNDRPTGSAARLASAR
jgi:MSHA biogenesis protein MshQ